MLDICSKCGSSSFVWSLSKEDQAIGVICQGRFIRFTNIHGIKCTSCKQFYYSGDAIKEIQRLQDEWKQNGVPNQLMTTISLSDFSGEIELFAQKVRENSSR